MTNSTPLSPAAQAVVDASLAVYWRPVIDTPVFHNKSIAAALRAAADQVVPHPDQPDKARLGMGIRWKLLAIAAELEGADG